MKNFEKLQISRIDYYSLCCIRIIFFCHHLDLKGWEIHNKMCKFGCQEPDTFLHFYDKHFDVDGLSNGDVSNMNRAGRYEANPEGRIRLELNLENIGRLVEKFSGVEICKFRLKNPKIREHSKRSNNDNSRNHVPNKRKKKK